MESKPISPKPENTSPSIPISPDLTELQIKTSKISEKINEEVFKEAEESSVEISENQELQKIKDEILEKIDKKEEDINKIIKKILKELSPELLNDLDFIKKVYNRYFFHSRYKLSSLENKDNLEQFYYFLSKNESKIDNLEVIKFLCLKSENPAKTYVSYFNGSYSELAKNHEFILDISKKFKQRRETGDVIHSALGNSEILKEIKKDKDLRLKVIFICPFIVSALDRLEGKNLNEKEELIEILTKSDHPFFISEYLLSEELRKKVFSDKNLLLTMINNSFADSNELRSFDYLCYQFKTPLFDIQNPEDVNLIETIFKNNLQFYKILTKYSQLFVNNQFPIFSEEKFIYELIENSKNKFQPYPFIDFWLDDIPLLDKICQIEKRYFYEYSLTKYLRDKPNVKEQFLKDRANYLIYLNNDREVILTEAKKLDFDQLKLLYNEIANVISPQEKEKNPLFYESLEKSLKILMDEKQVQKTMGVSKKVYFTFE